MSCRNEAAIEKLLSGRLAKSERPPLLAHVADCDACSDLLAALQSKEEPKSPQGRAGTQTIASAATVALGLIVASVLVSRVPESSPSRPSLHAVAGEHRTLTTRAAVLRAPAPLAAAGSASSPSVDFRVTGGTYLPEDATEARAAFAAAGDALATCAPLACFAERPNATTRSACRIAVSTEGRIENVSCTHWTEGSSGIEDTPIACPALDRCLAPKLASVRLGRPSKGAGTCRFDMAFTRK